MMIWVVFAGWRWFHRKSLAESQLELLIGGRMPCGHWRKMRGGLLCTFVLVLSACCMTMNIFFQREA